MKSRSFLPMVVRMTTTPNDDVILRSEAVLSERRKDLHVSDKSPDQIQEFARFYQREVNELC